MKTETSAIKVFEQVCGFCQRSIYQLFSKKIRRKRKETQKFVAQNLNIISARDLCRSCHQCGIEHIKKIPRAVFCVVKNIVAKRVESTLVLDHTRLAHTKPNLEPVRRLRTWNSPPPPVTSVARVALPPFKRYPSKTVSEMSLDVNFFIFFSTDMKSISWTLSRTTLQHI